MTPSPCTNICKMDASLGLCQGCFRTLDEITAWSRLDDPTRLHILAEIARRRLTHAPQIGDSGSTGKQND
ncbi:DUF1289 domain-containing protein [Dechloromonas sp. HYN0024]|jgi:predicted Fe-S protein YdhL (DUF1289 family)|uniref:DUF1289 domain-containing protein n=1 Tax=Dechloromonas sp. HYN0024 TaxID=2231055 RepID=UPI000E440429|nr:DUF1289 domain-containing protein [Dechloromonas sp. HYN0024]AXS78637.1 DUF1289 domain-containing protein [Dechloromonas sp. HYN0024]